MASRSCRQTARQPDRPRSHNCSRPRKYERTDLDCPRFSSICDSAVILLPGGGGPSGPRLLSSPHRALSQAPQPNCPTSHMPSCTGHRGWPAGEDIDGPPTWHHVPLGDLCRGPGPNPFFTFALRHAAVPQKGLCHKRMGYLSYELSSSLVRRNDVLCTLANTGCTGSFGQHDLTSWALNSAFLSRTMLGDYR